MYKRKSQSLREAFNDAAFQNAENCCGFFPVLSLPLLLNPRSKGHEDPNWREVKGGGAREEWRLDTRDRKEKHKVG